MSGWRPFGLALTLGFVVVVALAAAALSERRAQGDPPSRGATPSAAFAAPAGRAGPGATPGVDAPQDWESLNAPYDGRFHFARIRYEPTRGRGRGFRFGGREPMWAHDYPRGERNFMKIIGETTLVDALVDGSNVVTLDDPRLFLYPVAYIIEVGAWDPTDEEAAALGEYLRKGGFLIVDDFRGGYALRNFAYHIDRALPGAQLVQLDGTHEIFDAFFRVDPREVIPPYGATVPTWYGIFEDNDRDGRMLAIVNYDNDLSEYWEYSDYGYYPIDLSNEAYKLGVNYIVYALTH